MDFKNKPRIFKSWSGGSRPFPCSENLTTQESNWVDKTKLGISFPRLPAGLPSVSLIFWKGKVSPWCSLLGEHRLGTEEALSPLCPHLVPRTYTFVTVKHVSTSLFGCFFPQPNVPSLRPGWCHHHIATPKSLVTCSTLPLASYTPTPLHGSETLLSWIYGGEKWRSTVSNFTLGNIWGPLWDMHCGHWHLVFTSMHHE